LSGRAEIDSGAVSDGGGDAVHGGCPLAAHDVLAAELAWLRVARRSVVSGMRNVLSGRLGGWWLS
jgi:hypothetical protein